MRRQTQGGVEGGFTFVSDGLSIEPRYLSQEQVAGFTDIVFAIWDWSPERRYLAPFRDLLAGDA